MVLNDLSWLDQLQPAQRSQVGDKAFDLAGLMRQHYSVPPGFVVTATTLQNFLAQVDWQAEMLADLPNSFFYINASNFQQLQTISQQLQQAIRATPLPERLLSALETAISVWQTEVLVVRPSFTLQAGLDPTVSYKATGLFKSQLCYANRNALAHSVKQLWCELFRARSLFYWQRLGIQLQQIQFAALVQPVYSVTAAGELQINGSDLEVQAVWGLGHGLAQGTYDVYHFEPSSGWQTLRSGQQTYACHIANNAPANLSAWLTSPQDGLHLTLLDATQQFQPVLNLAQLQQLAQSAQQIQTELGMPLRLEWTFDADDSAWLTRSAKASPFQITQITPQFGSISTRREGLASPAPSSIPVSPLSGLAAAPGRVIASAWLLSGAADLAAVPAGAIVITSLVTPEQVIRLRQAAGLVTEQGGITSHAAILARELGIPAVVGVAEATQLIQSGEQVAIDGDRGEVYYGNFNLASDWQAQPKLTSSRSAAALLSQPLPTQLFVTLSQLDHLSEIAALPVNGIGLLRSELMLLDLFQQDLPEVWLRQQPQAAEQIASRVEQLAAAFAPRPVFYRSFDLQLQEVSPIASRPHPMLGLRGVLSYQFNLDLLHVQLDALRLVQQRGYDNVSLLLPFVRTVEEFAFCRKQVEQVGLLHQPNFQLWIMAEVPSVLLLLPDYVAAGVQGIAIGTNDLTQLLLGADRNHPQMAAAFDPSHPVVLRAVQQLISLAHQIGIPCSICGQSFGQSSLLTQVLQWGVTGISVDPHEVEAVYQTIQRYYSNFGASEG